MSKIIERIKEKAEQLASVRASINRVEEEHRLIVDALKTQRDTLQEDLLVALRKEDLASIKTSAGETYARVPKRSLNITNEIVALNWAIEHRAVSINKIFAMQELKNEKEMPAGFEIIESEYISVRKPKAEKAEAEGQTE